MILEEFKGLRSFFCKCKRILSKVYHLGRNQIRNSCLKKLAEVASDHTPISLLRLPGPKKCTGVYRTCVEVR